ncbi:NADH dehydrogenase [Exophiala aquamarina CBS 119918]|uniref:NADH dehydrogenase n=1 Tax=Exophiala aquamarina CBS 119918 TaxID=1182545 RepID=A0A072P1R2_9EURO|nr:NADH dehydrogenase [Exophiala aquamarina CBS 119918]KEF53213.1 NADH dehydrogenase [Exophiala aquamarina CBS 119918]
MQQRILVVGAGFGGLWSALAAKRLIDLHDAGIEVTVVAPEPRLVIRPRLYETDPANMTASLTEVFNVTGVQFIKGTVNNIDTTKQEVEVLDAAGTSSKLSYSRLILAAGSRLVRPNIPGLLEHSFNIDQLEGAAAFEKHLQGLTSLSPTTARDTAVVVGGGFTGIEIAAELPSRLRSILGQDVNVRVVIVERADNIGPELGAGPRPAITQAFNDLGVEMKLGAAIVSIDSTGVLTASGERIEARTVVWTGGMHATELTEQIAGDKDKLGRLHVDRDLRVPSNKAIFATGDTAFAKTDEDGHYALMSCQHAQRLGRSAGHNAAADLLKVETLPYTQPDYGTCLDLGPWGAVVCDGWDRKVLISGPQAKPIKQWVNTSLIYPPKAEKASAFAAADPAIPYHTLDEMAAAFAASNPSVPLPTLEEVKMPA